VTGRFLNHPFTKYGVHDLFHFLGILRGGNSCLYRSYFFAFEYLTKPGLFRFRKPTCPWSDARRCPSRILYCSSQVSPPALDSCLLRRDNPRRFGGAKPLSKLRAVQRRPSPALPILNSAHRTRYCSITGPSFQRATHVRPQARKEESMKSRILIRTQGISNSEHKEATC